MEAPAPRTPLLRMPSTSRGWPRCSCWAWPASSWPRRLLVPEGFGKYGHYRPGAVEDRRQLPNVFAGRAACEECHTDIAETKAKGKHAAAGLRSLPRSARHPRRRSFRQADAARRPHGLPAVPYRARRTSASFPQIDVAEHAPKGLCTECHAAHDPGLGGGTP
jgi:hypothetical protein